jgi:serine-type D-Ala-D-Ala endopeptidase (penicillin-binding protein 7)
MTRAVFTRGPRWALSLLLPVCTLLAVDAAQAAQTHAHHVTVKHAASHPATVARKSTRRRKTVAGRHAPDHHKAVASRHAAHRHHAVANAHRHSPVHRAVAHVDPDAPLRITASVAYVVDQQTGEVLLGRNEGLVHPIASLTKLMTGMIIAQAQLPMDEKIVIDDSDVDRLKFSSSRLRVGTELTRGEALHLALMSSENRAAHALARTYPGGESAFVSAMNVKARQLGMEQTTYVEPTGLSSQNQSSAHDLALLTAAAYEQPLLRRFTTSPGYRLATDHGTTQYVNTNRLVRAGTWDIGLQKTGYIREAGDCLILQAKLAGRKLIMVFLDSASALARFSDAEHVRAWLRAHPDMTAEDKKSDAPG